MCMSECDGQCSACLGAADSSPADLSPAEVRTEFITFIFPENKLCLQKCGTSAH